LSNNNLSTIISGRGDVRPLRSSGAERQLPTMPSPTEKEHMGTCPSTLLIFFCFSNRPTVRLGQRERWSGEGQHRMEQRRSRTRERAGSPSLLSFQGVGDGGLSSWTRFERKDELWDRKTAPDATTGMPGQSLAGDPFSPQPLTPLLRHVHARRHILQIM
jgi:hypothetical protein